MDALHHYRNIRSRRATQIALLAAAVAAVVVLILTGPESTTGGESVDRAVVESPPRGRHITPSALVDGPRFSIALELAVAAAIDAQATPSALLDGRQFAALIDEAVDTAVEGEGEQADESIDTE